MKDKIASRVGCSNYELAPSMLNKHITVVTNLKN